jgi:hypothetical protein
LNDDMAQDKIIEEVTSGEYKYGFTTDVQTDIIGKGLNEDVIRTISMKKGEPDWLLEFRLIHWINIFYHFGGMKFQKTFMYKDTTHLYRNGVEEGNIT